MEEPTVLVMMAIGVIGLFIIGVILPLIFNQIKKLWYLKKNSGPNGFMHESMFYDAEKGTIEADQSPLH